MMSTSVIGSTAPLHAAWHWWKSELLALLPRARWIGGSTDAAIIEISQSSIAVLQLKGPEEAEIIRTPREDFEQSGRTALSHAIEECSGGTSHVLLRLPDSEALRRTVGLPAAAAANLKSILKYELERHSPIDVSEIYCDHWVRDLDKEANRLDVAFRIVRRAVVDEAIALCRSLGCEPVNVGFAGDEVMMSRAQLALDRKAVLRASWRRWSVPALSALALFLTVATLTAAFARSEIAASELSDQIGDAQLKAQAIARLRGNIQAESKRAGFLAEQKQGPLIIETLSQLTAVFPDGTWIFEFQLNGREVRVRGFSSSASALIGLIDKSTAFANAQFRASLMPNQQTGLERFDLSFQLRGARE